MSSVWTLLYDGTEQTFEEWGLGQLSRRRVSQKPDAVVFSAPGASVESDVLFAYGQSITIKKDGVSWFSGIITETPRMGSGSAESLAYTAAGPWWHLEGLVFQQLWKMWDGDAEELANQYKTRCILGQTLAGTPQTNGAVINEVLAFAIAAGVPLQAGTISPAVNIPWDEVVDITCAEAIRRVLRWTPDAVCWFDYSTTPATFHCRRRSNLDDLSIDLTQGDPNAQIHISPRYDLQIPAVVLKYEQIEAIDDGDNSQAYESVTIDKHPVDATGLELRALVMTIELAGSTTTMESQEITVSELPEDKADNTWWKSKLEWLDAAEITNLNIHDGSQEGTYDNELVEGTIHEWMTNEVKYDDVIKAYADYVVKQKGDANDQVKTMKNVLIEYKCVTTSLDSGTYKRVVGVDTGENPPSGIAAQLYAATNPLHYDGQFTLIEDEVSGSAHPGKRLNITNGQDAWSTMNALIQEVREEVDMGLTVIVFGPPKHLGPADLIELLRANRSRATSARWDARDSGDTFDRKKALQQDAGNAPVKDSAAGDGEVAKQFFYDESGAYQKKVSVDPSQISKEDAAVDIKPREVLMLDTDQFTAKTRQIMASDAYGAAQYIIPTGGLQYQQLTKNSNTTHDIKWDWTRFHS